MQHVDRYIKPKLIFTSGRQVVGHNGDKLLDLLAKAVDLTDLNDEERAELETEVKECVEGLLKDLTRLKGLVKEDSSSTLRVNK